MAADVPPASLAHGSAVQRAAHRALTAAGVMRTLSSYTPVLAGTIPLGIDVAGSDLDVICEAHDLAAFERALRGAFGACPGFAVERAVVRGVPACIASFTAGGFPVEVFAQPRPVREQDAVRHLRMEARVLAAAGADGLRAIRELRSGGLKTEPAFAAFLGLAGDPYEAVLGLERLDDEALLGLVAAALARDRAVAS
jgi:hypothetical protein